MSMARVRTALSSFFVGPFKNRNRLVYMWLVLNGFGAALLFAAYQEGYITKVLSEDMTGISLGLMVALGFSVLLSGFRALQINADLNRTGLIAEEVRMKRMMGMSTTGGPTDADLREALSTRLSSRIESFNLIANLMVAVGIIGTVIGIIMGFADIPNDLTVNQTSAMSFIKQVLSGLSTAFLTTLVGAIGAAWTSINHHLLSKSSAELYAGILEGGNNAE